MEQQKSRAMPPEHRHRVGMRIIKTVVAVFLCGVLAFLRDKSALYSMFAALFCVQNSTGKTFHSSIDRALGTLIGGVVGVLTVYAMDTLNILHIDLLRYLLMSLLLIPVIELCLVIKKPGCAGMACMVVMCLVVDPGNKPAIASIERLFETVVGVVLASGIDVLLPYQPVPPPAEKENESPPARAQAETPQVKTQPEVSPAQAQAETPQTLVQAEAPQALVQAEAPQVQARPETPQARTRPETSPAQARLKTLPARPWPKAAPVQSEPLQGGGEGDK